MIDFTLKHPLATHEMLGLVPDFFSESDPSPAAEQVAKNYKFGGWRPFQGFTMTETAITYPGDPPMSLLAEARLRDEVIRFYNCAWLAIIQPDGSYEISRVD